ncbi:Uncharacterized protein PCOAH_00050410 [Plasmodium coatneyi]|uniref:Uncharacterized protein n=1 Tax=Plasmodium coatneyi TaxID=208452 RepID=A0A1B1E6R8_9APIC|nr:Uncharacterized protein PCOAH_00050410 [Plasmodium coatneyi]ANQ10459.1 Uncharacterized protein PCOAH_00050410 [Plasmodium coatneyi]
MKNDNTVVYKNNTWSIYNNKSNAPGNKKRSRVEYLTLLGKGQLFDGAANENEGKQSEVTDMYIYTGKGVEKVSINTATKERKNEMNKNKRYQYLKDKITNALKNQEMIKQITSENEFANANENDPSDVFIFDKLKNEISIFSSKGLKEEEHKKGTDDATVDTHPLEESSFPHTDVHTTEDIFPRADVHAEATASVTCNRVGEIVDCVTDDVGILPGEGGYNRQNEYREDEVPPYKKNESEFAIQPEDRAKLDDEKETPNEVKSAGEDSTKPNGEFFIHTEKCSDFSSETDDEIDSDSEVEAPKWESQPERGKIMSRLKNQTREVKQGAKYQRGKVPEKHKKGKQGVYKREVYEGGCLQKGWHENDPYEESWSEDSQGEYRPYKDASTKHGPTTHRRDELHSVQKEMHHLKVQINKVKEKMKIINNKKNGKINVLNKKINILKNKLSDGYVNNLNDDINIFNSQIDILFIKKINKMYKQINSYVKNINDQIGKNLSTQKTMGNLDPSLYSHIQRQISNIKIQVSNLHDQVKSHMYQQKSNKMFNQMNSQINNTNNQIGRHLGGHLDCQRGELPTMDSKRIIPNEQCMYKRSSKGSLSMEEDLSLLQHEKKMRKKKGIVKKEDYLYRDNTFCKNTYHELHEQINFNNADEDANLYSRVGKHNGGTINVEEYLTEGDSYSSNVSVTKCGTHRGKTIRGGSKGYNSSGSCKSRNSKRRKTRKDNEPNYDHLKRKKKLIHLFSRNIKRESDKYGDATDRVNPQSEVNTDGVHRRSAVETDEHTGLRSDEHPSGGQTVICEKGDALMQEEGPSAHFGDERGKVGTVEGVEVIDVEEVIQAAGVINLVDETETDGTANKGTNAEEAYRPFSDQKLMYLKKKLMQLDLFKKNQKRKNEEDDLNQHDIKADTSEQANEKDKIMAPIEVANGSDKAVELVSHTEKGNILQNSAQSTHGTRAFMFVEEGQAAEVGGSSDDAYGNYNTKHHSKGQTSQSDSRRESYPNGNMNNASESKDFVSIFQKLVRKESENGQSEHKGQNFVPHLYGNIGEDTLADDYCLSEKSTFLPHGDQRKVDKGGKHVDMLRHFFFLKDDMKGSQNVQEATSMDNTSSDQNGVAKSTNGWREPSSYPSASEATNENCGNGKNAQLTNSFTIDQIYDYTVDYYRQMRESQEGGSEPQTFTNI